MIEIFQWHFTGWKPVLPVFVTTIWYLSFDGPEKSVMAAKRRKRRKNINHVHVRLTFKPFCAFCAFLRPILVFKSVNYCCGYMKDAQFLLVILQGGNENHYFLLKGVLEKKAKGVYQFTDLIFKTWLKSRFVPTNL